MLVGVPREVKVHEHRVALTPAGVHELVTAGHRVFVEEGAGEGSAIADAAFSSAGAEVTSVEGVWEADLVVKVKEPMPEEFHRIREAQVLFAYLHLAASVECTQALIYARCIAIAYETVQLPGGSLPLLYPMSEVAGRMAPQVGARYLEREEGGRGVLLVSRVANT